MASIAKFPQMHAIKLISVHSSGLQRGAARVRSLGAGSRLLEFVAFNKLFTYFSPILSALHSWRQGKSAV